MSERMKRLRDWLDRALETREYDFEPASEDASFRCYYRVRTSGDTFIVMDAPPEVEDCGPFLDVTARLRDCGVNVPEVYASDLKHGFLLLGDLGTELYLQHLDGETSDALYTDAIDALLLIQEKAPVQDLPDYDETLLRAEMNLFRDWLLAEHLGLQLNAEEQLQFDAVCRLLADTALDQPQVFVHRDYHSRNLIVHERNPGIIDYQDAVLGPVTYDLVSLLKDCYIKWPKEKIVEWQRYFYERCRLEPVRRMQVSEFHRCFDFMGVQRHLKASGIFARLYHRDGKAGFLSDVPRTLSYITDLEGRYPGLEFLIAYIRTRVLPGLQQ